MEVDLHSKQAITSSHSTVHDIAHKHLHLHAQKLQLWQHIKPANHNCRNRLCEQMLQKIPFEWYQHTQLQN
jgi:hypothetical protein